jgi:acetyl-CoA synthetase
VSTTYPVPAEWAARALISAEAYADKYRQSIEEPEAFWRQETARLDWIKPWTQLNTSSFDEQNFGIGWFTDGTLNVSANCLDRHLAERGEQTAIIWEGDDPSQTVRLTYAQLHAEVNRFANVLKKLGAGGATASPSICR